MSKNKAQKPKSKELPLATRRKLALSPCKTRDEFSKWIQYFLGIHLPDCKVSRYADTTPLDAAWEIYNICVNRNNPDNLLDVLYCASRGSGKTLGMAIAEFMILLHDKRSLCHVGAILQQAKRCYDYQQGFFNKPRLKDVMRPPKDSSFPTIIQRETMEKSVFLIDDEEATMEVLPLTLKACNDPESLMVRPDLTTVKARDLKAGDEVLTLGSDNALSKVVKIKTASTVEKPSYRLTFEDGSVLIAAKNHKILSLNGWLEIQDLNLKSSLIRLDSRFNSSDYAFIPPEIDPAYSFSAMVGMMLGDGHISFKTKEGHQVGNPRFYLAHSESQFEYLEYCKQIIEKYVKVNQVREKTSGYGSNMKELITESHSNLNLLKFFFHPNNSKKSVPANVAELLDEVALAFWFMDDGNGKDAATFATCGFDLEGNELLVSALKTKFSFSSAKTVKNSKGQYLIKLDTDDRKALYELIAPHVPPSMSYKLANCSIKHAYRLSDGAKVKFSKNGLPQERDQSTEYRAWRKSFKELPATKVVKKEYLGWHPTVELEIDSNNFAEKTYLCNGFVSHNTNGPHVALVVVDEIDTVSGEGAKAFKEISGMLDSRGGKRALRVGISTRKGMFGLMNKQIEDAERAGRKVKYWTALEFTERCPDERSGTTPTDVYVIQEKMEALSEADWRLKDEQKQKEYTRYTMYDKCVKCPSAAICLGDAKNQNSPSPMLKSIDELNQKILSEGADWALSQLMNLKPSLEGVVYREFEEKTHTKTWNEMWKTLTGTDFPGECTHDIFVKKCHDLKLNCYAGIDWGWSDPSTAVYFFMDRRDNVFVVRCDGRTFTNDPTWIHYLNTKYQRMYRCQLYFPDTANGSAIDLMKVAGLPVANKQDKSINLGIQVTKRLLRTPGSGEPKIFFAKETCVQIVDEFKRYHYKQDAAGDIIDEPDTEHDHWLDALRYPLTMLLGKGTAMMADSLDFEQQSVYDATTASFKRPPTPEEFAAAYGISVNPGQQDASTLGRVGKLSEIDPDIQKVDNDDGDIQGGGSFLWSFE